MILQFQSVLGHTVRHAVVRDGARLVTKKPGTRLWFIVDLNKHVFLVGGNAAYIVGRNRWVQSDYHAYELTRLGIKAELFGK